MVTSCHSVCVVYVPQYCGSSSDSTTMSKVALEPCSSPKRSKTTRCVSNAASQTVMTIARLLEPCKCDSTGRQGTTRVDGPPPTMRGMNDDKRARLLSVPTSGVVILKMTSGPSVPKAVGNPVLFCVKDCGSALMLTAMPLKGLSPGPTCGRRASRGNASMSSIFMYVYIVGRCSSSDLLTEGAAGWQFPQVEHASGLNRASEPHKREKKKKKKERRSKSSSVYLGHSLYVNIYASFCSMALVFLPAVIEECTCAITCSCLQHAGHTRNISRSKRRERQQHNLQKQLNCRDEDGGSSMHPTFSQTPVPGGGDEQRESVDVYVFLKQEKIRNACLVACIDIDVC